MKKRRGFTLVELLVVIAILAILATVSILGYTSFTKKAKLSNDKAYVAQVNLTLKAWENGDVKFTVPSDVFNKTDIVETKPLSEGYFIYNGETNRLVLVDENYNVVEGSLANNKKDNWLFTSEIKDNDYSLFLYEDYSGEDVSISDRNIDTGKNNEGFKIQEVNSVIHVNNQKVDLGGSSYELYGLINELEFKTDSYFKIGEGCVISLFKTTLEEGCFKVGKTEEGFYIWLEKTTTKTNVYVGKNDDVSSAVKVNEENKASYDTNINKLYEDLATKEAAITFNEQLSGAKITLANSETISGAVSIDHDCEIDLNGKTLTISSGLTIEKGKTVTIKNGTLSVSTTASGAALTIDSANYSNQKSKLYLDNATINLNSKDSGYGIEIKLGGTLDVKSSSISANNVCLYIGSDTCTVNLKDSSIVSSSDSKVLIKAYNNMSISVDNCSLTGVKSNLTDNGNKTYSIAK